MDAQESRRESARPAGRRRRSRPGAPCGPAPAAAPRCRWPWRRRTPSTCVSASHVRNVPSSRRDVPLSPSPVASAFLDLVDPQHARRHRLRRRQRLAQVALRLADVLVVDGSRSPAAAAARRRSPQRLSPRRSCRNPGRRAAARLWAPPAAARCRRRRACAAAATLSGAPCRRGRRIAPCRTRTLSTPPRLNSSYLACITAGRSLGSSAPSSKITLRASRSVSPVDSPPRFSISSSSDLRSVLDRCAVGARPVGGDALDDRAALDAVRKRQPEAGGEMLQLARQRELVADQHYRARGAVIVLTDVLQQPHVHRIGEERMEVEQHVDAGDGRGAHATSAPPPARHCVAARRPN